ncbi:unnamed protein product, partial [Vitis vinifera]
MPLVPPHKPTSHSSDTFSFFSTLSSICSSSVMARLTSQPFILTSLLFIVVVSYFWTPAAGIGRMVGGRTEIKDVKTNKEVQQLGRFSVEEYNRIRPLTNFFRVLAFYAHFQNQPWFKQTHIAKPFLLGYPFWRTNIEILDRVHMCT